MLGATVRCRPPLIASSNSPLQVKPRRALPVNSASDWPAANRPWAWYGARMDQASSNSPVLRIALWEPEIPPNTGNVARLCAATGAELHLIGRLGFRLDDRRLRRAGLEYWSQLTIRHHVDLQTFED